MSENAVRIVVTAQDAGATKVIDSVTASTRAAEKQAQRMAEAQKLAERVMKETGAGVSQEALRMVKAQESQRNAAADLAKVQTALRKGYLEEATGSQAAAAALEKLTNLRKQDAAAVQQAERAAAAQAARSGALSVAGRLSGAADPAMLRLVRAREEEAKLQQQYSTLQASIRNGYLSEAEGANAAAVALHRLNEAKRETIAASAIVNEQEKLNASSYLKGRFSEHLGEFGITEGMAGATMGVAAALAVTAELVNKMREVVSESLEFGEQMERASQKTGLAVETLSVVHYAAKTTGGDFDGMTAAIAKMGLSIAHAAEGNKTALAFLDQLGFKGKAAARALAENPQGAEIAWKKFIETMGVAKTSTERQALAFAMLGKAGGEQIPTIIDLAKHWDEYSKKAEETGNKLSAQTAEQLAQTNEKLKELKQSITGAGMAFTEGFTPAFSQMLDVLAGGKSHLDAFKRWGDDAARTLAGLADVAYSLAAALEYVWAGPSDALNKNRQSQLADARDFIAQAAKMHAIAFDNGGALVPYGGKIVNGKPIEQPGASEDAKAGAARGFQIPDLSNDADKAAQKKLKAMEAELAAEKLQFGATLKSEYDFWEARRNQFKAKSDQYNAIIEKQAALAEEAARQAHEKIQAFQKSELRDEARMQNERRQAMAEGDKAMHGMNKDAYTAQQEAARGSDQQGLEYVQGQDRIREFQASQSASAGDAARLLQQMHEREAERQMQVLARQHAAVQQNPYLTEAERQKQLDAVDAQIERLRQSTELQALEDQKRIESTTLLGGMNDAIRQFVEEATNAGAQMRQLFGSSLNSVNSAIVRDMTEPGWKTRGQWGNVGHDIFSNVASAGLKGAEGNLMKMLGLGGAGKHDGSSESAALFVRLVGAGPPGANGLPKLPGMNNEWGGSDSGGLLSKLMHGFHMPNVSLDGDDSEDGGDGSAASSATGFFGSVKKLFGGLFGGNKSGDKSQASELASLTMGLGQPGGSSPANPLYVKNVDGTGSMGSMRNLFGGGSSSGDSGDGSGGGGLLASLFGGGGDSGGDSSGDSGGDSSGGGFMAVLGALTGAFAGGTDFAPGGPALVGERGPEIVNLPRGSQVVPNHRLGSMGGPQYHHHGDVHVDARGATNPAEVEAAGYRGAMKAIQQMGHPAAAMADYASRRPGGRGR